MAAFHPELGQFGFGNTPWQAIDSPVTVNPDLEEIAAAICALRGEDPAFGHLLTSNSGADPYETDVFAMRAYCWCDGVAPGHENGCPPNFEHHATGLVVSWYKHSRRSRSQNRELLPLEWETIVASCFEDIAAHYDA